MSYLYILNYVMTNYLRASLFLLFASLFSTPSFCQDNTERTDKLYSMSGIGLSLPVGESSNFMRAKFSTTVGVNLGLGNQGLFLYPQLSLHVFGYDNSEMDSKSNYILNQGRASSYLMNVALGYRKITGKFAFYGFIGAGGGFILTPRVVVNAGANTATLNNKTNHIGIIEPGAGVEYNLGGTNFFAESSYMRGLGKIGDYTFKTVPLTIGIKPNLSRLLYKNR